MSLRLTWSDKLNLKKWVSSCCCRGSAPVALTEYDVHSVQTVFLALGSAATSDTVTFTDYSELRPLVLDSYVPYHLFWRSPYCQLFCYCANALGTHIPYLFVVAHETCGLLSCGRGTDQAACSSWHSESISAASRVLFS